MNISAVKDDYRTKYLREKRGILSDRCADLVLPPETANFEIDVDLVTSVTRVGKKEKAICKLFQYVRMFRLVKSSACDCCNDTVITRHACVQCSGTFDISYHLHKSLEIRISDTHKFSFNIHIIIVRKCTVPMLCSNCTIRWSRRISMCDRQLLHDRGVSYTNTTYLHSKYAFTSIKLGTQIYNFYKNDMKASWNAAKDICESKGFSLISLPDKTSLKLLLTALHSDNMKHLTFGLFFIGLNQKKAVSQK